MRERKVTVFRCVAETTNVQRQVTDMVPETRTRTETFTVQVPITRQVTQQYQVCVPTFRDVQHSYTVAMPVWGQQEEKFTVMVPHTETRQASRQVVNCIPVAETRSVCVDRGHWEQPCQQTCGYSGGATVELRRVVAAFELWSELRSVAARRCGCAGAAAPAVAAAPLCRMTWVPNIVQEPIQVTVMKPQITEVPYQYNVTVCTPETRSRMIPVCHFANQTRNLHRAGVRLPNETRSRTFAVCDFKTEQRSREVQFTVCVPHQRTFTEQVVNYRNVPEEKTEQYTVMVPHEVEKSMCVQVCHMVPHEATVQTCCSCDRCSRGCRARCCGY